jgi:hypothetical protein
VALTKYSRKGTIFGPLRIASTWRKEFMFGTSLLERASWLTVSLDYLANYVLRIGFGLPLWDV